MGKGCPFRLISGLCKPKPDYSPHQCSWVENGGRPEDYKNCFVYQMHTHPDGPGDFLRKHIGGRHQIL